MLQLAITEQNSTFTRGELYYKTIFIGEVVFLTPHRPRSGEYLVKYWKKNAKEVEIVGNVCLSTTYEPSETYGSVGDSIEFGEDGVVAYGGELVAKRWHSVDNSRAGDETLLLVFDLRRALI